MRNQSGIAIRSFRFRPACERQKDMAAFHLGKYFRGQTGVGDRRGQNWFTSPKWNQFTITFILKT